VNLDRSAGRPIVTDTTRDYYEAHAAEYADFTWRLELPHLWPLITDRLPVGASLLDLGCGSGRDLRHFSQAGIRPIGVDYSGALARLARQRTGQVVVQADMRALPFTTSAFEAVWAVASLLHIQPKDLGSVLRDIHRVMTNDGVFVASVKVGTGALMDDTGRFFAGYTETDWSILLTKTDFHICTLQQTVEVRHSGAGPTHNILWLVSVCTKMSSRS
jgi:SAM-dependent methyltransferase